MSQYEGKDRPYDHFSRKIEVGMRVLYAVRHGVVELQVMRVTALLPSDPDDPYKRKTQILEGNRESDGTKVKITRTHRCVIIPEDW
jgi:hypothetical protein